MSIELITLLMFGSFFLLLALGLPLAFVLGGLAVVFGYIQLETAVFPWFSYRTSDLMNQFSFIAIPLFIFMANVLRFSGVAEDLYEAIYIWMGPLRGGLAIASIVACTIIAAMVGTVGAGVVVMGLIALPAMLDRRYNKRLACGSIMAGGSLGVLIPPSVLFIIYATFTAQSVGKLFIGGIIPGLILSGLYILFIIFWSYIQPKAGPAAPPEKRMMPLRDKFLHLRGIILPIFLIMAVMGSIFLGVTTVSEAAGVGALGAIIAAAIHRKLNWNLVKQSIFGTIRTTGMIMWITIAAYIFVGIYLLAGGDKFIRDMLLGFGFGPWGVLIIVQLLLILLGMVLDWIGILVLVVPIVVPLLVELGFSPIWFGILFCVNMQIAYLSPPFGYAMFYLKGVAPPEISMTDLYRSVWPFIIIQLIGLAIIMAFPQTALWLPSLMGK